MRTIKFRAWDRELKKIWDVLGWDDKYLFIGKDTHLSVPLANIELMQFTGLFDKSGVEIYEGDILSITTPSGRKCTSQVVWKQPPIKRDCVHPYEDLNGIVWWGGNGHEVIGNGSNYSLNEGLFEIIGNIYEHPHLLGSN